MKLTFSQKTAVLLFVCSTLVLHSQPDSLSVTPNPFQKRTLAYYSFGVTDTVSLDVFSITGANVLNVLTNSVMPAGIYMDSLALETQPDGIYIVMLKLGSKKPLIRKIIKSASAGVMGYSKNDKKISVFPNPVNERLTLDFSNKTFIDTNWALINQLGQTVGEGQLSDPLTPQGIKFIDVAFLQKGIYSLKINTGFEYVMIKLIKEE